MAAASAASATMARPGLDSAILAAGDGSNKARDCAGGLRRAWQSRCDWGSRVLQLVLGRIDASKCKTLDECKSLGDLIVAPLHQIGCRVASRLCRMRPDTA